MKTAEQILKEHAGDIYAIPASKSHSARIKLKNAVLEAMKEYASQALDKAADSITYADHVELKCGIVRQIINQAKSELK